MVVTTNQLADFLDLTPRRVQILENEGILEKIKANEWDLKSNIHRYFNYKIDSATENYGLTEARAKKEKAEAEIKELILKEKKEEVISLEKLEKELSDIAITLSNTLYNLPHKIKREIALSDEVEEVLIKEIENTLHELKNTQTYKEYLK